jgi:hypothetical protein
MAKLAAVVSRDLPGIAVADVGLIVISLCLFIDSVNPQSNQMTSVYAFLLGINNLHPAVSQSPLGVVLGGLWNPPAVLRSKKVAGEDKAMNASKQTEGNAAIADALLQKEVVAVPIEKLLTREPLIVRTRDILPGNTTYPHQVRRCH